MKLDKLDQKILFELEKNARLPHTKIAKLTHSNREVVTYRIKRLESSNVIMQYNTILNQSLFCTGAGKLTLTIARSSKKRYGEILKYVIKHPRVNWVGEICGSADLSLTIMYKDSHDLGKIIEEILQFMNKDLISHHLTLYTEQIKFTRTGILELDKKIVQKEGPIFSENKRIDIDEKDVIILKYIAKNARIKNLELSKLVGLKEDMIRIRLKKLEKAEIIKGYTILLNPYQIGYEGYLMSLNIAELEHTRVESIKAFVNSQPFIYFTTRMAGEFNLMIGLYAKNRKHFNTLLIELRTFLGASLKSYEFQMLLSEPKEVYVPVDLIS